MENDPEVTAAEAARLLGINRTSVYALIRRGELAARRLGPHTLLLSRAAVLARLAQGPLRQGWPRGRPRKTREGPSDE